MAKYTIKQTSVKILKKYIDDGTCKDTDRKNKDGEIIYSVPDLEVDLLVWPLREVDALTDDAVNKLYSKALGSLTKKEVVKAIVDRTKTLAGNNHLGVYTRDGLDPEVKALVDKAKSASAKDADFKAKLAEFMKTYDAK